MKRQSLLGRQIAGLKKVRSNDVCDIPRCSGPFLQAANGRIAACFYNYKVLMSQNSFPPEAQDRNRSSWAAHYKQDQYISHEPERFLVLKNETVKIIDIETGAT
jgi:hypothetical protein